MFTASKRKIIVGCLVATCTAAAVPAGASAKPTITMSGSTTVAPLAAKLARGYLRAFPDATITVEDQLVEGDRVVTRWTGRGTQTGEFMDMPPSDKRVAVTGVQIDRFSGDKIVEEWTLFDQLGMFQQLGVIQAPEQAAIAAR